MATKPDVILSRRAEGASPDIPEKRTWPGGSSQLFPLGFRLLHPREGSVCKKSRGERLFVKALHAYT